MLRATTAELPVARLGDELLPPRILRGTPAELPVAELGDKLAPRILLAHLAEQAFAELGDER